MSDFVTQQIKLMPAFTLESPYQTIGLSPGCSPLMQLLLTHWQKMAQVTWALPPMWSCGHSCHLLGLSWLCLGCYSHLGSKSIDEQ